MFAAVSNGKEASDIRHASGDGKNNTSSSVHANTHRNGGSTPKVVLKDTRSRATQAEVDGLLSQIARDLKPWKESGISLEMVEKAYCTEEISESMRFQVTCTHPIIFSLQCFMTTPELTDML